MSLQITATSRTYPALPFAAMAKAILGSSYELSLTFVGAKRAATLNEHYRGKTYTPNVLSFPLTPTVGEIYICPLVAKKEASKFDLSYEGYVGYLFIHGCLHLTGLDHGTKMDELEAKFKKQFKIR